MKKFLGKVILIAVAAAFLWAGISSYQRLQNGQLGIVEEVKTGIAVKLFTSEYNFIWHGAFPNLYRVRAIPGRYAFSHDILLQIPPVTDIKDDRYSIKIPVSYRIEVDSADLIDQQLIAGFGENLKSLGEYELKRIYYNVYGNYIADAYRRDMLIARAEEHRKLVRNEFESRMAASGFRLIEYTEDLIYFPSYAVYYEGVAYQNEHRSEKMSAEREMMQIVSGIERKKIENQERFEYLGRVSEMIKDNPEILKYIYIDRIAGDVKVVISSDRELVPGLFRPEELIKPDKIENDNLK